MLEIDSNDTETMTSLAIAYLRTNRNEPAKELLTAVVRKKPDKSDAFQYLGYCYLRLNDVDHAVESYGKAIEINNRDWQAYRGLGVAYMLKAISSKDQTLRAKAIEQWRLSLEVKPDQPRNERLRKLVEKYSEKK